MTDRAPWPPGTILRDRYDLGDPVGAGSTGTVYRAVDRARRREVAVKVGLWPVPDPHSAGRLVALRHPNVVRLFAIDRQDDRPFVVMEHLRGETLAQVMRSWAGRAIPGPCALALISQVGEGLAALHRAGWVHGDLKPGNVFLTHGGGVKLIDLGLPLPGQEISHAMTPAYASPPVRAGRKPAPRDDVFSLATLAYGLLVGGSPFSWEDGAPRALRRDRPACLDEARWALIRLILDPDSRREPPGAALFARRLAHPAAGDRAAA